MKLKDFMDEGFFSEKKLVVKPERLNKAELEAAAKELVEWSRAQQKEEDKEVRPLRREIERIEEQYSDDWREKQMELKEMYGEKDAMYIFGRFEEITGTNY